MQSKVDGNTVFVCDDDFVNLQESNAVFGDTRDFAAALFTAMVVEGVESAVIYVYVHPEKLDAETCPDLLRPGKIPRVTIEWVDVKEAEPGIEARLRISPPEA